MPVPEFLIGLSYNGGTAIFESGDFNGSGIHPYQARAHGQLELCYVGIGETVSHHLALSEGSSHWACPDISGQSDPECMTAKELLQYLN